MCSIVDANVFPEVFNRQTEAGTFFYNWLMAQGQLLLGGSKLKHELRLHLSPGGTIRTDKDRLKSLRDAGRIKLVPDQPIDAKATELNVQGGWKSDDWHILALILLHQGDARLLFSNDTALHEDYVEIRKGQKLKHSIYTTQRYDHAEGKHVPDGTLQPTHRNVLTDDLCLQNASQGTRSRGRRR